MIGPDHLNDIVIERMIFHVVGPEDSNLVLLEDLCQTMKLGSLCALGGFTPYPVLSALRHFPEDFRPGVQGSGNMPVATKAA